MKMNATLQINSPSKDVNQSQKTQQKWNKLAQFQSSYSFSSLNLKSTQSIKLS